MEVTQRRQAAAAPSNGEPSAGAAAHASAEQPEPATVEVAAAADHEQRPAAGTESHAVTAAAPSEAVPLLQPALPAWLSSGQGCWRCSDLPPTEFSCNSASQLDSVPASAAAAALRCHASNASSGDTSHASNDTGSDSSSDSDSSSGNRDDRGVGVVDATDRGDRGARTAMVLELLDLTVSNVDAIEPHHLRLQVKPLSTHSPVSRLVFTALIILYSDLCHSLDSTLVALLFVGCCAQLQLAWLCPVANGAGALHSQGSLQTVHQAHQLSPRA